MKQLRQLEKILLTVLIVLSVVFGAGMGVLISTFEDKSDIRKLENFRPEIPTKIFDRNGTLISELFIYKREPVPFEKLPRDLINALLAIEDVNFYSHRGINLKRVFGALMANIRTGRRGQGASTITMQLARTLFTGREKTYTRKLKEIWLSLKIEKRYSKNEILTLYFNQIYFGHGAYGIEAASQFYFDKHVNDLTLAECAMLAGLPQSPNRLSPLKNPSIARTRQELVLENMVRLKMVSSKEAYDSFQDFWVNFMLHMRSPSQSVYKLAENKAPHFVEYVRQKLERLYGPDRMYTDGLKVYTTLDLAQQTLAEKYLVEGLERQNEIYKATSTMVKENVDRKLLDALDLLSLVFDLNVDISSRKNQERVTNYLNKHVIDPLDMLSFLFDSSAINRVITSSYTIDKNEGYFQTVEGAFIALEPKTGYVTAMVGGSTFSGENQINRAVQIRRQTGSGFKPYIYTAAIDTKIFTPASIIVDSPVVFFDGEREWIPDNYGGSYRGKVRLREALRRSINVVTAKIVDRIGIDTAVRYSANILGFQDPREIAQRFPKVYSIALGVVELSPFEMAKGFATFANRGKEVTPLSILYVLDRDGNMIDNFEAELRKKQAREGERQAISEQTNYIVTDMLRDVLRPGGTAYAAARDAGFDKIAAGKTGTTQNWKDAWFTGFTTDLVASVWMGFDRNSISLGRGQAGGVVAAPVWAKFMRDVNRDKPESWFSMPKGVYAVKVCKSSGLLPTKTCSSTITEIFLEGTIPTEYCRDCDGGGDKSVNVEIFKRRKPSSEPSGVLQRRRGSGAKSPAPESGVDESGLESGQDGAIPQDALDGGGGLEEVPDEQAPQTPLDQERIPAKGASSLEEKPQSRTGEGEHPAEKKPEETGKTGASGAKNMDEKMEILLGD